jgi:glutathione S-transferase
MRDIAAAPAIDRVERLGMADLWSDLPAVKSWVERVTSRSAYRRAAPPEQYRMPKPIKRGET